MFKDDKSVKDNRKKLLNEYFRGLYRIFNVELLDDEMICKFIEIDQSIKEYLTEDYTTVQRTFEEEDEESSSRSNSADMFADWATDKEISSDKVIRSFLSKIHKHPKNKANILKSFEDNFFNLKISLEIDSIKRLFFGDSRDGLLKMASEKSESYLASSQVVSLLAKLLDTKRNVYAESFNKIFATWKPEMVKTMRLDSHIISQKACETNDGWFIIYNYLSQKSIQGVSLEPEQVLSSEEAIEIYTDWIEKKKPNEWDQSKNSKSLIVQIYGSKSEYEIQDDKAIKYRENSPKNRSVGISQSPNNLSPNNEIEEISDEVPLPDFNNLPSVK